MDKETATVITKDTQINFIRFIFDKDKDKAYYSRPYILQCFNSIKKIFPNLRVCLVNVSEAIKTSNRFSDLQPKNSCYETDPLRLFFINKLDNAIYCDTDVFILEEYTDKLIENMNKNDTFVVSNCSGTITWNKHKNNNEIQKWWNLYNHIVDEPNFNIQNYGDISMYHEAMKQHISIPSINDAGTYHMSCFYPAIRDKVPINILLDGIKHDENRYNQNEISYMSFPICLFEALQNAINVKYHRKINYVTQQKEPGLYLFPISNEQYANKHTY